MDEVDGFFRLLAGSIDMQCIRGVLLVDDYRAGLSIHSVPILAEVSRAREVVEQLGIERIVALDVAHEERLRRDGVVAAIELLDPEEEVARQQQDLEQDVRIQAGVEKLRSVSRPNPTADPESTPRR